MKRSVVLFLLQLPMLRDRCCLGDGSDGLFELIIDHVTSTLQAGPIDFLYVILTFILRLFFAEKNPDVKKGNVDHVIKKTWTLWSNIVLRFGRRRPRPAWSYFGLMQSEISFWGSFCQSAHSDEACSEESRISNVYIDKPSKKRHWHHWPLECHANFVSIPQPQLLLSCWNLMSQVSCTFSPKVIVYHDIVSSLDERRTVVESSISSFSKIRKTDEHVFRFSIDQPENFSSNSSSLQVIHMYSLIE